MIGALYSIAGPEVQARLRGNLIGLIAEAFLTGVGFVLLVPFLRALLNGETERAATWLAAGTGVFVLYAGTRYRTQLAGYRAAISLARALFARLGDHIVRLPLGWFGPGRVGRLGRLTSQGVIDVMGVPAHLMRPLVSALITPATVIVFMFVFDWRLALAALVTTPVALLTYRWSGDLVQRTERRVDAAAAEAAGRVVEFAQAQAVLRAFGQGEIGFRQLDAALIEQHAAGRAQLRTAAPGLASFVLVVQLAFTVIVLFGLNLVLGGEIEVAELIALLVLSVRYVEPLIGAADLEGTLRISRNSLARMDALLATKPLPEPQGAKAIQGTEITFARVGFAYDGTPLLRDVSFTAPARAITAIVGVSGSGKTTLLRLIARFWDVDTGAVLIGGADVRDVTTADLMAHVSVVFQDVYLFDGSIADNIRVGRPGASDAEIADAARMARVDEIAARMPGGLNAGVGEAGGRLSGGERQRISIARAILKDAPIVLLDEATSALDPINEAAIQDALRALTRGKTLITVAHWLQTVRSADRILVLDEGRIVESGSHDELITAGRRYAAFWKKRARAAGWRIDGHGEGAS